MSVPTNFIPVSKGNLYQMRRFCGISKNRQALSSPDTHQKQSWFTRNSMSRDEQGNVLNPIASPSTSNWHHTKRIQHSKHSFVFVWDFFHAISALLKSQPRWEEPSEKTIHSPPATRGEDNQNTISNRINQFQIFIFCDAPVSFLLNE